MWFVYFYAILTVRLGHSKAIKRERVKSPEAYGRISHLHLDMLLAAVK